jgi:hypothetical protein
MLVAAKPPRPRTRAAALLMLVGGLVMIIGAVLPWISHEGTDFNAFDEWTIGSVNNLFVEDTPPGGMFVLLGVVLIGFGIATLAAGRVLPIMIIGIVVAAFAVLGTITHLADYADVTDATTASLRAGIVVTMIGSAAALAGAIAGCATRRRWRPGAEPR